MEKIYQKNIFYAGIALRSAPLFQFIARSKNQKDSITRRVLTANGIANV